MSNEKREGSSATSFIVATLIVGIVSIFAAYTFNRRHSASRKEIMPESPEVEYSCPEHTYDSTERVSFSRGDAEIFAWPSTGGVLIKENANGVDLGFLGLDRFKSSSRSRNAADEDAFCTQLRKLGATWWNDPRDRIEIGWPPEHEKTEAQERVLIFGWPASGGVWVLHYENQKAVPEDAGRIGMAFTMDERCVVMEEYGATFFQNPDDCQWLQDTATKD